MQIDRDKARQRLIHEAREFVSVFLYLYLTIGAITVYKSLTLRAYGIDYFPLGFALIKALILAKFIITGNALRVGSRFDRKPLIYSTLYKALVFFVLLLALSILEETIRGMLDGKTLLQSALDVGGGTLPGLLAYSVIGFLVLLPYIALGQLSNVLGEGRLFDLFFKSGRAAVETPIE